MYFGTERTSKFYTSLKGKIAVRDFCLF